MKNARTATLVTEDNNQSEYMEDVNKSFTYLHIADTWKESAALGVIQAHHDI